MEYWSARDLAKVLDYAEYRNFLPAIDRAKEACQNSGQQVTDHFVDIHEMIEIGKGGKPILPYKPACRKSDKWWHTII